MSNDENKTPSKVQYNSSATTYTRSGASPGRSAFSPKVSFLVESPHTVREGNNDLGLEPILSVSFDEEAEDNGGKVEATTAQAVESGKDVSTDMNESYSGMLVESTSMFLEVIRI